MLTNRISNHKPRIFISSIKQGSPKQVPIKTMNILLVADMKNRIDHSNNIVMKNFQKRMRGIYLHQVNRNHLRKKYRGEESLMRTECKGLCKMRNHNRRWVRVELGIAIWQQVAPSTIKWTIQMSNMNEMIGFSYSRWL